MGVRIDESRNDREPVAVDDRRPFAGGARAHVREPSPLDAQVPHEDSAGRVLRHQKGVGEDERGRRYRARHGIVYRDWRISFSA